MEGVERTVTRRIAAPACRVAAGVLLVLTAGCAVRQPAVVLDANHPASPAASEGAVEPPSTTLDIDGEAALAPEPEAAPRRSAKEHAPARAGTAIYTCPMHPEVQQAAPGRCPKCGMTLERTSEEGAPAGGEHAH
jgi:hypothetical protein